MGTRVRVSHRTRPVKMPAKAPQRGRRGTRAIGASTGSRAPGHGPSHEWYVRRPQTTAAPSMSRLPVSRMDVQLSRAVTPA
jgi:hypothetical protein